VLWNTIIKNPEIDVIGSRYETIDSQGVFIKQTRLNAMNSNKIRLILPFRCCIPHPTVVFKKECIIKAGGYSFGQFSEDYDLWLRVSRSSHVQFLIIDDVLLEYRLHESQATGSINDLNILAYDLTLKLRELIVTKNLMYFPGIIFTIIDFFYKKSRSISFNVNYFSRIK
jgi:hypothetical protein